MSKIFNIHVPPLVTVQKFTSTGSATYGLSYAFSVSAANATAGAAGGNGYIEVTEYYV